MRRTIKVVAVAAFAVALVGVGSLGLFTHVKPVAQPPLGPGQAQALQTQPALASTSLDKLVASLQARLQTAPDDWRSYANLGLAYVQEARVTADPTYYPKAEGVLQKSLDLHPDDNFEAYTGMAALTAARHDFAHSLTWGQKATAANPYSANAFAVVGDAQVELGRYPEAFDTFQHMIDLRPELSTYARVSYGWELQGDVDNAVAAMQLALQSAGTPQDAAWAANQLGDLYFNQGRVGPAEEQYRRATDLDPTFVPAHAGLARVAWARGDVDSAIEDFTWVVDRYPSPEYVIALGDLDTVAGRTDEATREYQLVGVEQQLFRSNGVNLDMEIALYDADHSVDVAGGLAAAQAEWGRRQSVTVADALGWSLYANGRYDEALGYANRALALGTRNALFFFHRGMIERALGRTKAARRDLGTAIDINPHFSIRWSSEAGDVLASLGGAA
jgi:tetratricopeptide (TPR) repeat protein